MKKSREGISITSAPKSIRDDEVILTTSAPKSVRNDNNSSRTVMKLFKNWIEDSNNVASHFGWGLKSPVEYRKLMDQAVSLKWRLRADKAIGLKWGSRAKTNPASSSGEKLCIIVLKICFLWVLMNHIKTFVKGITLSHI